MQKVLLYVVILFLTLNTSCNQEDNIFEGVWIIKEINLDGEDLSDQISSNIIVFKDNMKCKFPLVNFHFIPLREYLVNKENGVTIKVFGRESDDVFQGEYNVSFLMNESLKKVVLMKSERVEIKMEKTLKEFNLV